MNLRLTALSIIAVLLAGVGGPAPAVADPSSDLAAAEESVTASSAQLSAAEQTLDQARESFAPIKKEVNRAVAAAKAQLARAEELKQEVLAERREAAEEVETAENDYQSEKSTHDTLTAIGIGLAVAAVVIALGAVLYSRFRKWPLKRGLTRILSGGLVLILLGGLGLALLPSEPEAPLFSPSVERLAGAYEGNPLRPPTPELVKETLAVKPLLAQGRKLQRASRPSAHRVEEAESEVSEAQKQLASAKGELKTAQSLVVKDERLAAEESEFKEEATEIGYAQLIKNADAYKGDKVVYSGQVFQIQEFGSGGIILLAVTNEGYGFWTNNIWVDYNQHVNATEEDIITVYGTITGSKEYETQAGGSTYVPRMRAKYIEE